MLKDRSSHRGNLIQALIASPHWTAMNTVMFLLFPTLLAVGNSAGESLLFEVLNASIVVRKLAVKIFHCVPQVLWNCLSAVHVVKNFTKSQT